MVEQIGKIACEKLDRYGLPVCPIPMAAAIVDQDRRMACEPLGHRLPEPAIHGERMNEHDPFVPCPCTA
jgi:hypothetical protein